MRRPVRLRAMLASLLAVSLVSTGCAKFEDDAAPTKAHEVSSIELEEAPSQAPAAPAPTLQADRFAPRDELLALAEPPPVDAPTEVDAVLSDELLGALNKAPSKRSTGKSMRAKRKGKVRSLTTAMEKGGKERVASVRGLGIHKALGNRLVGRGELKNAFSAKPSSGLSDGLFIGSGVNGMRPGANQPAPILEDNDDTGMLAGDSETGRYGFAGDDLDGKAELDGRNGKDKKGKKDKAQKTVIRLKEQPLLGRDLGQGRDDRFASLVAVRPTVFLPRMGYFENTYLGGNAAYEERLRRLEAQTSGGNHPWLRAALAPQDFDAPAGDGLALDARLDRSWVSGPGRVMLQIGLQGSDRYGWRRPPLDIAVLVERSALAGDPDAVRSTLEAVLLRLEAQDHIGVYIDGPTPMVAMPLTPAKAVRGAIQTLDFGAVGAGSGRGFRALADLAGARLRAVAEAGERVPGAQTVIIITRGGRLDVAHDAEASAHALSVQGAVTSVIDLAPTSQSRWWAVANAGHGNYHRVGAEGPEAAVASELASLSRVVARLLRININLAPNVQAVRILGSRMLQREEIKRVKAREVATDRQMSRTMGVTADRGDDDEGLQVVIPYFYGGDSHVILVELWVEGPGPVAEISLRYKDLLRLDNASAHRAVGLDATRQPRRNNELHVAQNAQGFVFAEAVRRAANQARTGGLGSARATLHAAGRGATAADRRLITELVGLTHLSAELAADALTLASDRRIGTLAQKTR